jgi:DNA repair exonuclease SbcCD nuclease subunit
VDQKEPITIEVDYLSGREIEELIKELVWNYRQIFLPEIEEDKVDARDYARYQRESEQAWSALEAGFKHQREFKKEFVSDMSEGALDRVTNRLIQWTRDIEWPESETAGRWTSTAQNAEECYEKTSTFMRDRFWPFTKIIR